jgi:hypothetical protein
MCVGEELRGSMRKGCENAEVRQWAAQSTWGANCALVAQVVEGQ